MYPVLFHLGSYPVTTYALGITLGYFAGLALLRFLARAKGLSPIPFFDLALLALVTGLLGARLLFVLTNFEFFRAHPEEIFSLQGGMVFYGGFLVALPACLFYAKHKALPPALALDLLAPPLALAHAVGRVGCFFAGCCHGSHCPYPWAITLQGENVHPVQLYEAAALALLALMLVKVTKKTNKPGRVALLYVAAYAMIRLCMEFFRGDEIRGFVLDGWFSVSQAIALVLLAGCGFFYLRLRRDH